MWTDKKGVIQIDEHRMNAWFISAIQNLKDIEQQKKKQVVIIFNGSETVHRANNEDLEGEA